MSFPRKMSASSGRLFFGGMLSLIVSTSLAAGESDPISRVENFLEQTATLSAQFVQTLQDDNGRVLSESTGTMAIKRPGRFLWHYESPEELVVLGDGREVWSYDVELENATVASQDETLSGNPAALLAGDATAADAFEVSKSWRAEATDWVELVPRDKRRDFRIIRLGFSADMLSSMELQDQLGQTTRIVFGQVIQNQPIDDELFVFTPPAGVDVITAGGLSP